jgi:heme iron utilization protein
MLDEPFARRAPLPHEPRLTTDLRALLHATRVAALGTLDDDGAPFVSMVPYAIDAAGGTLVIHVSGLAPHTRNLHARPQVSMLVMQPEVAAEPVHALPRVTLECAAMALEPNSPAWQLGRAAYVKRFPEAEYMTQLGDFIFFALQVRGARQVAGFGAARSVGADDLRQALGPAHQADTMGDLPE